MADRLVARHYEVAGQVQGVGFRYFTLQAATRLGLAGTVRNTASGTVEIDVRGTPEKIDQLEDFIRRGPPGAVVLDLNRSDLPDATPVTGFRIV